MDLAADDGAKPGDDIAADAAASHRHAEALSFHVPDLLARYPLAGRDQHVTLPGATEGPIVLFLYQPKVTSGSVPG